MTTDTWPSVLRLGITGTDTGIGKTVVTCALAALARERGQRVAAMKPVESGIDARATQQDAVVSDADRLREACGNVHDPALVRPYVLDEPLAPMVAARRAGVTIDLRLLDTARATLERGHGLLLVEGAGGLLVPVTERLSYADLFARWQCDVVLVAGNKLGVINHVLLTVQAIERAGLTLRGVVLTALTGSEPGVAEATNFDALCELLPGHALYRFPWISSVHTPAVLAAAAASAGLGALLEQRPDLDSTRNGASFG